MTAPILRFKDQGHSYPDWVQKKLKDCVTFSKGGSLSKSDLSPHGATPCLLYGELYTTYGEVTKAVITQNLARFIDNKLPIKPNMLISF